MTFHVKYLSADKSHEISSIWGFYKAAIILIISASVFVFFQVLKCPVDYTNKYLHYRMLSMNKHFLIGKSCSMYHLPEVTHFFIQYYFVKKYSIFKGFIGHIEVCYIYVFANLFRRYIRPPDKTAHWKTILLISQ